VWTFEKAASSPSGRLFSLPVGPRSAPLMVTRYPRGQRR
jgi:hypothetical protein